MPVIEVYAIFCIFVILIVFQHQIGHILCFILGLVGLAMQVQIPSRHVARLYDAYTCLAKNSHGSSNDTLHLIEARKSLIV